jgi:Haloacid dehalogenase-like hydrolase
MTSTCLGFDFDNTIVSYDELFHKVALEQGVIHQEVPINKLAVRDYLRQQNQEHIWTEMQGYVYGARMDEAQAFPHALDVLKTLKAKGYTLAIVSHKTKYPYLGNQYDLHAAARRWIENYLCDNGEPLIAAEHIYFELTKEAKLARITHLQCDLFVDDLPEILLAPQFPNKTQRLLFDPEQQHDHHTKQDIKLMNSWLALESYLS